MSNPVAVLNGDQIYLDELIRKNARLTVQVEAERQHRQELEAALAQLKQENETLFSQVDQALEKWTSAAGLEREKVLTSKLDQAIHALHFVMAGGDACKVRPQVCLWLGCLQARLERRGGVGLWGSACLRPEERG